MSDLKEWAKLATDWYEEPDLVAAADTARAAFAMWPVLVAKAKGQSHATRNPDGSILIAPTRLAFDARCDVDEVGPALDALAAEGLIRCSAEGVHKVQITLTGFAKWQAPRGSNADKQQRKNAKKQASKVVSDTSVTPPDTTATPPRHLEGEGEGEREGEQEGEKTEQTPPKVKVRKPRKSKPLARVSDSELDARITACFDWYCELFGKTGVTALTFTQKRYDAIAWALVTFTGEQVAECIRGFHSDPWRREELNRHDITTLLRDEAQVERGIDMAIVSANRGAAHATAAGLHLETGDLVRIERALQRDLTGDEEAALQSGAVTVEAFLAEHGVTEAGAA